VAHQLARNVFISKQSLVWDGDPLASNIFVLKDVTVLSIQKKMAPDIP
jgi:hypothetical protein